jgi:hypothetical protein
MLYKDAKQMVEHLAHALKQTSRETIILLYAPALDPHLKKMTELADRVFCFYEERKHGERAGKDAWSTGRIGGILMKKPWIRDARLIEPRPAVNHKVLELQTAKDIQAEVFNAWSRRGGGDDSEEAGGEELALTRSILC